MQLSKLTFSLASLVIGMAFAFKTMPVMAHEVTPENNGTWSSS